MGDQGTAARGRIDGAVVRFALSGIAALVVLGAAGVYLLQQIGKREAIRDAKRVAQIAGRGTVEPFVTPALERGDRTAIARLDRVVRHALLPDQIVRIKIWAGDGRIVYSDEHRLIGSRYRLASDDLLALRAGTTEAGISDLSRPENRFERRFNKLLEVYLPIRDARGRTFLFEDYERYSSVAASGRRLWLAFAPAIVGALVLLWLIQLPLAWRAARRLRHTQAERETFLSRAIEASEVERRRIARDLHDGAVQNLAGVSYSLTAAADRIASLGTDETAATMREAAGSTRGTIKELRSLLVDLYPPDLHRTGLRSALRDLVATLSPRGITAHLEVPDDLDLPPAVEMLFYRCAQEALRNVAAHAGATEVTVSIESTNAHVELTIEDDGRGFEPEAAAREGHFGLTMLADVTSELGGRLDLRSSPGAGTLVRVDVPR